MEKYKYLVFAFILILTFTISPTYNSSTAEAAYTTSEPVSTADAPKWIYIPSIKLFSYIEGMGIDTEGRMDTPSGRTNNVGWYKYGVLPGDTGTAVIGAHNTAAFKNLHALTPGSDIYVFTTQGKMLRFTVREAETHSMAYLTPQMLFEATQSKQLNLITCAGALFGNGDATHRHIVSAQLKETDGLYSRYSTISSPDTSTTSSTVATS